MSVADASFEEAWGVAKAHPDEMRARVAAVTGGPSPSYMSVMGNKGTPMHQALNRFLYGKSALRSGPKAVNRRLIEPFMGGLDVAFAVRPDLGLFANDRDRLMPMIAEYIRDSPEKVSFDPRKLLSFPGDELSLYDAPATGNFDPVATFELPSDVFREVDDERLYDGGAYLPFKYYQLRAETNRKLEQLRRGELSTREEQELSGDMIGLQRALMNSIIRYNPQGFLNSATGAKDTEKDHPRLSVASSAADYLQELDLDRFPVRGSKRKKILGKRGVYGAGNELGLEFGPSFVPQRMGQVSRDPLTGKPDISPYNMEPWSDMMQDYHFYQGANKDFRNFLGDISLRSGQGTYYGDTVFMDPPYGQETGQHAHWSKKDTGDVYSIARQLADANVPNVVYNDASPTTIAAIRENKLPISLMLARRDKQAASKQSKFKIKPETVVANIPGMNQNYMHEFSRDLEGPNITGFKSMSDIPDWMYETGKATRLGGEISPKQKQVKNKGKLAENIRNLPATTIVDPMTGLSQWMETDPNLLDMYRGKGYFAQPRYDKMFGRQVA
tara:strand:- start:1445 stop:3112 length:1668 start_codon:yes stop_codon:yes gene_type:complete